MGSSAVAYERVKDWTVAQVATCPRGVRCRRRSYGPAIVVAVAVVCGRRCVSPLVRVCSAACRTLIVGRRVVLHAFVAVFSFSIWYTSSGLLSLKGRSVCRAIIAVAIARCAAAYRVKRDSFRLTSPAVATLCLVATVGAYAVVGA